jgi:cysteine synthase
MKDRMARSMILGAERRGELRPGGRVVDYTGGRTGCSLAMVCAARGYRAHFVSADAFSEEKLQTMRAFGARLDVVPSEGGKVTAGSFSGNAEVFKAKAPGVRCVAGEPATSAVLSGPAPSGGHRIEGTGAGFVPSIYRGDLYR